VFPSFGAPGIGFSVGWRLSCVGCECCFLSLHILEICLSDKVCDDGVRKKDFGVVHVFEMSSLCMGLQNVLQPTQKRYYFSEEIISRILSV
jgi:hypothetical protein